MREERSLVHNELERWPRKVRSKKWTARKRGLFYREEEEEEEVVGVHLLYGSREHVLQRVHSLMHEGCTVSMQHFSPGNTKPGSYAFRQQCRKRFGICDVLVPGSYSMLATMYVGLSTQLPCESILRIRYDIHQDVKHHLITRTSLKTLSDFAQLCKQWWLQLLTISC